MKLSDFEENVIITIFSHYQKKALGKKSEVCFKITLIIHLDGYRCKTKYETLAEVLTNGIVTKAKKIVLFYTSKIERDKPSLS